MKHMAQRAKVSPLRTSFHIASIGILNILRFDSLDSAGNLPKHLESLLENLRDMFCLRGSEELPTSYERDTTEIPKKMPVNFLTDRHSFN